MIENLVYLYILSPLQVLLNELEELDEIAMFDLAHESGDQVISLKDAISEVEQARSSKSSP
jgi:hypothetical protein